MPHPPLPGRYDWLSYNAPMSGELAESLVAKLAVRTPATVVDIGCGWAELLVQVLVACPEATGLGVDKDRSLLRRAEAGAERWGVQEMVEFAEELPDPAQEAADVVLCVGADHIFGSQLDALRGLLPFVRPGGRLLFGTGFWESPPSAEQAASVGLTPPDLGPLAELVELAVAAGYRLLDLRTATRREWEEFEFGFLADWEEWLHRNPGHPDAPGIRELADNHRTEYLRGWSAVLGFAYLTLGRAAGPEELSIST
jgi:SAM-dependent methyltransferase